MHWGRASRGLRAADLRAIPAGVLSRFSLGLAGRGLAGRLWAALLVLTVALSAFACDAGGGLGGAPGTGLPGLRHGSAFSLDTVEMAVAPARTALAVARSLAPLPLPLVPLVVLPVPVALGLALPRGVWPASTGPPLAVLPVLSPGTPRAPPFA